MAKGVTGRKKVGGLYFSLRHSEKEMVCFSRNRRDEFIMTGLRPDIGFGHCGLAICLKFLGKHTHGLCSCGSPETLHHVLLACKNDRNEQSCQILPLF